MGAPVNPHDNASTPKPPQPTHLLASPSQQPKRLFIKEHLSHTTHATPLTDQMSTADYLRQAEEVRLSREDSKEAKEGKALLEELVIGVDSVSQFLKKIYKSL